MCDINNDGFEKPVATHGHSASNIATGMIRGGHKYAFNPLKIRFRPG
jgi:hypothetical protein